MVSEPLVLIGLCNSKNIYIFVFDFFLRCFILDDLQLKQKG